MNENTGSVTSYSVGFVLSIILTVGAYLSVTHHVFSGWRLGYVVIALAIVQFFAQMLFFLHLGRGSNRRLNLLMVSFMIVVVFIVVVGSLWIMHNLSYRMTPRQMNQYMQNQDGGI